MEFGCKRPEKSAVGALQNRLLLLAGCVFLILAACAKELPTMRPADLPASLILDRIEQRRSQFSSFRAVGNLRFEARKQRLSGRVFLLSRTPQSLRLELVGFFGQPLLYLVSDGNQFATWDPTRNRAYQGSDSENALTSFIGLPLGDRDALLLLVGIVPEWNYKESRVFRELETENLVLQLENAATRAVSRVWLQGEGLVVTKIERAQGSRRQFRARFADFVAAHGSLYPTSVTLEGGGVSLNFQYQQFTVNESLEDDSFRLALPKGVEILPW